MFSDEGWIYASLFKEMPNEFVDKAGDGARRAALYFMLLQLSFQERKKFRRIQWWKLRAKCFLQF